MLTEVVCDSSKAFQAYDPSEPVGYHPVFDLGKGFQNIIGLKITDVILPISWPDFDVRSNEYYQYRNSFRQIRLNINGVNIDVDPDNISSAVTDYPIRVGASYTPQQYASLWNAYFATPAFQTACILGGLTGPVVGLCTYRSYTNTFVFKITDVVSIVVPIKFVIRAEDLTGAIYSKGRTTVATMLGMEMGDNLWENFAPTKSSTFETQYVNFPAFNHVYLCSNVLGQHFRFTSNSIQHFYEPNNLKATLQEENDQIALIPLNKKFGEVVHWRSEDLTGYYPTNNLNLQQVDFYFMYGPYTRRIPLGSHFVVKLLIEYEDGLQQDFKQRTYMK